MKQYCRATKEEFEITSEEVSFYQKFEIPLPTLCPEERQRRRIAYRNFRSLYQRSCSATGKRILSMYDESVPFPVYEQSYWWSDSWNARSYAQDFDFSRPFFEQYQELVAKVPRFSIMNLQSENCHFSNFTFESRNCYLIFGCVKDEDCLYGHIVWESQNCVDNLYVYQSKWCSHCVDVVGCYDVHFSTETVNSQESYFLHDCRNCSNCFGCLNLRNKQYYFLNQPCTREEYQRKIKEIMPLSSDMVDKMKLWLEREKKTNCCYPALFSSQVEDVSGDHLYQSHSLSHCFDTKKSEDCKYCYTALELTDCFDLSFTAGPNRYCVDCLTLKGCEDTVFSNAISDSQRIACSEFCYSSHDLFGCLGLRRAEYAILNKEYSREEYVRLRSRIIEHMQETGEWGEFFPMANSPFAYNEAIVNEYYPLTQAEAIEQGLGWKEEPEAALGGDAAALVVPKTIDKVNDEILTQTFRCEKTGKPFKFIGQELSFYRRTALPLPRRCPNERHLERMKKRQLRKLWPRSCSRCQQAFESVISPGRPETVLCEKCYLAQVQ